MVPERKGTFLIRLSSNDPDCLVLSKREKKICTHRRIYITSSSSSSSSHPSSSSSLKEEDKEKGGGGGGGGGGGVGGEERVFLIKVEEEGNVPAKRFRHLNDLVLGVAVPLKLVVPCPGSMFDPIFETHKTPTIEYVNQGVYMGVIKKE